VLLTSDVFSQHGLIVKFINSDLADSQCGPFLSVISPLMPDIK